VGSRVLGCVVVVVCLGGCAGVPSGGAARVVRRVPAEGPELPETRVIRRLAIPPKEGAPPAEIVRGYLTAQTAAQNDHGIARLYLAPQVSWNPAARAVVYTATSLATPVVRNDSATVHATVERVGSIGPDGEFVPASPPTAGITFRLRRVPGSGWRLTEAPPGVLLNRDELGLSFQRTTLYFPDQARRLVPEIVFLPASDQPVVAAAHALLAGPRPTLAPAVRSAIPDGTELLAAPVIVDGVAQLNFSREIRRASQDSLGALVAQLVWTLTDASPQVTAVRVEAEGEPLSVPGKNGVRDHRRSDWEDYAPVPATFDRRLFYVQGGAAWALDEAGTPAGVAATPPIESLAVNRAGTMLAAVTRPVRGRRSLLVADLTGARAVRTLLTAARITAPTWEPGGDVVWVAHSAGDGQQVVAVPAGAGAGAPAAVGAPLAEPVAALRLSPDGARVALVSGVGRRARLLVARVERTAAGGRRIAAAQPVAPSVGGVTAVTWDGTQQLTLAAVVGGRPAVYRVDLDGYNLVRQRDEGLPGGAVTALTASTATPPDRVASSAGRLWRRTPGADWTAIAGKGGAATYAG
jgi:hypothetical protein